MPASFKITPGSVPHTTESTFGARDLVFGGRAKPAKERRSLACDPRTRDEGVLFPLMGSFFR
ncbi:MAG: hypothetical protein ACE5OZ_04295 [Candidatus Heimdallarchaeota archaeon]